jgi:hypothetical protein
MNKSKTALLALSVSAALMSAGCTMGYMASTYGALSDAVWTDIDYEGETYRIFDRKDLSKVMITASLSSAALNGAVRGATFGGVNIDDDQPRYTKAATVYLAKDRIAQTCKILEGKLLVSPQWEFAYLCVDNGKPALSTSAQSLIPVIAK